MAVFTLNISKRTSAFGETEAAERQQICHILLQAIQTIGSGRDPEDLKDANQQIVGDWFFGSDSKNR